MRIVRSDLPLQIDMWDAAWLSQSELYRLLTTRLLETCLRLAQENRLTGVARLHVLLFSSLDPTDASLTLSFSRAEGDGRYLNIQYPSDLPISPEKLEEFDALLVKRLRNNGDAEQGPHLTGRRSGSKGGSRRTAAVISRTLEKLKAGAASEIAISGDAPLRLVHSDTFVPTGLDMPLTLRERHVEVVAQFCEIMCSSRGANDPVSLRLAAMQHERLSRPILNRGLFPRQISRSWEYCDVLSQYFERTASSPGIHKTDSESSRNKVVKPEFLCTDTHAPISVSLIPAQAAPVVIHARDLSRVHAREYYAQVTLWKEQHQVREPFGDASGNALKGRKTPLARDLMKFLHVVEGMPLGSSCLVTFRILWLILHEQEPAQHARKLLTEFEKVKAPVRAQGVTLSSNGTILTGREYEVALLLVGLTMTRKELQHTTQVSVPFENIVALHDLEPTVRHVATNRTIKIKDLLPEFRMGPEFLE